MQKSRTEIKSTLKGYLYMELPKRRLFLHGFFLYQFKYFSLLWMFHNRGKNYKINRLHERCLRIIYSDKESAFIELLNNDNSVSIHK